MEPIKKNGLDREVKRHEMNVEKIQTIVNDMIEMGFVFETGELRDLGSSCVILHDRAIEMAQTGISRQIDRCEQLTAAIQRFEVGEIVQSFEARYRLPISLI